MTTDRFARDHERFLRIRIAPSRGGNASLRLLVPASYTNRSYAVRQSMVRAKSEKIAILHGISRICTQIHFPTQNWAKIWRRTASSTRSRLVVISRLQAARSSNAINSGAPKSSSSAGMSFFRGRRRTGGTKKRGHQGP